MRIAELSHASAGHPGPPRLGAGGARLGLLQHHQVLHRGVPRAHQDHRQRADPDEGARRDRKYDPVVWLGNKLFRRSEQNRQQTACKEASRSDLLRNASQCLEEGFTLVAWGSLANMGYTHSINEIRTAIRELTARAESGPERGPAPMTPLRSSSASPAIATNWPRGPEAERRSDWAQPPSLRKVLRWKTIGGTSSWTVMSLTRRITIVWSPAGTSCSIAVSSHTLVPLMKTAPPSEDTVSSPANRSPVLAASVRRSGVVALAEHADTEHGHALELGPGRPRCSGHRTTPAADPARPGRTWTLPTPPGRRRPRPRSRSRRSGSDRKLHAARRGSTPCCSYSANYTPTQSPAHPPLSNLTPCRTSRSCPRCVSGPA